MNNTDDNAPVEAEIEGDQHTWWYVCSECHTYLNSNDKVCRCCHRRIIWAGAQLNGRSIYTGEQTEPAE